MNYLQKLIWGDQTPAQIKTSITLAALFFLIIGSFWMLGSLQEPIFYHLVGSQYHPQVNIISFFCIVPLMLGYMALLDRLNPRRLFVLVVGLYALFFAGAALLLCHPTIGLANTQPHVTRLLGWAIYTIIKTYGSFLVTLFWSFAVSVTTVEAAKDSFPFIMVCAQLGSLGAATLVRSVASWGIPQLVGIAVGMMLLTLLLFWSVQQQFSSVRSSQPVSRSGLFEGLSLLRARPYLRSVLVVSTAYLIITALVDYQMHYLAHQQYPAIEDFTWFKGVYGQVVNALTLLLALGGTRIVLRTLGVARALLLYPLITAVCVGAIYCFPSLWPVFVGMVLIRALSFGLNSPTKEIVYIPESSDVRFKVKSWIDMIGYRASFAFGSQLTSLFKYSFEVLVPASLWISVVVLAFWVRSAVVVGKKFGQRGT